MTEREAFEAWCKSKGAPKENWWVRQLDDGGYSCEPVDKAWEAWQARAQPAQAVPASCGECGKKTSDGWALYCVACMEEAGLPAQAVPQSWPTDAMIEAGRKATASHGPLLGNGQSLWHIFRDMYAAAAPTQAEAVPSDVVHLAERSPSGFDEV